jgi:predicted Zn-dependent peptidase
MNDTRQSNSAETVHRFLPCGVEFAAVPLLKRHIVSFQIRILAGTSSEPPNKLGLAGLVEETLDKGTQRRSGRELSSAFDAIGAMVRGGTGRETMTFTCTVLPEHFEKAVALHAEFLRTPTFPEDACRVAIELAKQDLMSLEDDAQGLTDKFINLKAFGPILGRHELGERPCLDSVDPDDFHSFWRDHFHSGRMLITVAGAVDGSRAADVFEKHFQGFGSADSVGREPYPLQFTPGFVHYPKELEQEQIAICYPGVSATDAEFSAQQVLLGVLSGGMSGRLFTEVRERLGLVYWVSAGHETPRGHGMIFLGASTTPERCDQTFQVLMREIDRLAEDLEADEIGRAVTGILAAQETRGDGTRARCGELAGDVFHFGRPIPIEEKTARIQAVTVKDLHAYLAAHPRDRVCAVTLGPRPLQAKVA